MGGLLGKAQEWREGYITAWQCGLVNPRAQKLHSV